MTVTIEEAQARLQELIEHLSPDEPLVITKGNQAVAQLMRPGSLAQTPEFGCCRGMLTINAEDDEHLQDFADYMP